MYGPVTPQLGLAGISSQHQSEYDVANDVSQDDAELVPDYTVPVEEVYRRFAQWCLVKQQDLDILDECDKGAVLETYPAHRLPSWVPDWRNERVENSMPPLRRQWRSVSILDSRQKPRVWQRADEPGVLRVRGAVVDRIDQAAVSQLQMECATRFLDKFRDMDDGESSSLQSPGAKKSPFKQAPLAYFFFICV